MRLLRTWMLLNGRAVLAEGVGTAVLVMAVVGSGISATRLTDDVGVQLLINAVATVAVLGVLIASIRPVSGAHLNPVVTLVSVLGRSMPVPSALAFVAAQVAGACVGTLVAHGMFEHAATSAYGGDRSSGGQYLGEVVATAGLVALVLQARLRPEIVVPAWIGAAYFFTSSTSFANPAVTVGRALTDTFAGIAWADVPVFVIAQIVGAAAAMLVLHLTRTKEAA